LKLFGKSEKKDDTRKTVETTGMLTQLEQLCGSDKQTYESLHHVMFLDPRKVETPLKEAIEKARSYEKDEDLGKARIWYDVAGGLAIYEGNVKKVTELFSESERLSGMKYPILSNTERAVAKAKEFYEKYLK
jgi:hypothetical protein